VGEIWRVPYEERAREARAWANEQGLAAASHDRLRICLVAVDVQNTFCIPSFELFVPGAVEDNRRLCEFVYRNLGSITQIVPTLDTHQALQIFHAAFLVDREGGHPAPYTLVSADFGSSIRVVVTATNGAGSAIATSDPTGRVKHECSGDPCPGQ